MKNIYKGHNSIKTVGGDTILGLSHRLMMLYINAQFHENIPKGFSVIERTLNHDVRRRADGRTDGRTR